MNVVVEGSELEVILGKFGVPRMNESGRKLTELFTENKLSMENTFFEKKIHRFTRLSGVDGHKSLQDLTVVQEEDINKLLDVNIFRGAERENLGPSLSDELGKITCN